MKPVNPGSNPGRPILFTHSFDDKTDYLTNHTHKVVNGQNPTMLNFDNFEGFFSWIQTQFSKEHVIHLKSYFNRHLKNKCFESPLEINNYVNNQEKGYNNLIKTARSYLNFCQQFGYITEDIADKYRSVLKIKQSRQDYFVPSDKEMVSNYHKIKGKTSLNQLYLVLATSGVRVIEGLDFLKNYNPERFVVHKDYVVYSVSKTRNTKTINNIYLPMYVYNKLKHVTNTYNGIRQRFNEKKCSFSLKYLRKWNYNFLLYHGVPESVADFIQGRANNSVSANHYLARSQQAGFWYGKMAPKLQLIFRGRMK